MRSKLNDLMTYHPHLDAKDSIELLKAFEKGNLSLIAQRIGPDKVNCPIGSFGFLPLELAIIYDHRAVFDHLVYTLRADVNVKNRSLESLPLVALAFQRRDYLFELLEIDVRAIYDCTHDSQRTLVHEAAICGDAETIKRLLDDFGFYKNLDEFELSHLLFDVYGCTPLYYACWKGFADIVQVLLECCDRLGQSSVDFTPVRFIDDSLSVSILNKRFECAQLLLTAPVAYSFVSNQNKTEPAYLSELDAWLSASVHLHSQPELVSMCNLFHELVLNGAKFTSYVFKAIDAIPGLKEYKTDSSFHLTFTYGAQASLFLKSLAFVCGYNLGKLFASEDACQMFLKSCFVVIHKLFISQLQFCLDAGDMASLVIDPNLAPSNLKSKALGSFLTDLKRLAQSIYVNGYSLKYLAKFKYLEGLAKNHSVLHELLHRWLYSYATDQKGMNPLKLADICNSRIKQSIKYLDPTCFSKLDLPRHMLDKLTLNMPPGLETSEARREMNSQSF